MDDTNDHSRRGLISLIKKNKKRLCFVLNAQSTSRVPANTNIGIYNAILRLYRKRY